MKVPRFVEKKKRIYDRETELLNGLHDRDMERDCQGVRIIAEK